MIGLLLLHGGLALAADPADGSCSVWGEIEAQGSIQSGGLSELSGLGASLSQDALWAVNDSGGGAVLYALGADGADRGALGVSGAENLDWEDLAVGPCESGCACLFVADVGDQEGARDEIVIWRLPEPDLAAEPDSTAEAEALIARYPDGAWDAETLLVDPGTGEVFLIPKSEGVVKVYALPAGAVAGEINTLEVVGELDLDELGASDARLTGGSVSPGGRRVALRTNEDVFVFTAPEGGGVPEALAGEPARFDAPEGEDGEAIAWSADGASILLSGEGVGATLWSLPCLSFASEGAVDAPALCEGAEKEGCGCGLAPRASGGALGLAVAALLLARRRRSVPAA